jgi:NTP pyrophosphatase (non-canonical NTP hydrolase)
MNRRSVSADFVLAMEQKLEWGRSQGRTGWDSHWKNVSVDSFGIPALFEKLQEELDELHFEAMDGRGEYDLEKLRLEAADVANVAMMIADMAGALREPEYIPTPEPPPVEGDTVDIGD